MHVMLNGEPTELPGPMTIAALLERLGIDGRMVAVEYNFAIIERERRNRPRRTPRVARLQYVRDRPADSVRTPA
jgi:thiamine biosynthesis protein ThiS